VSEPARTYNQAHAPRPYEKGRRRVSIYVSWSYPAEANRDITVMDNRFSTMTEVRRAAWPAYEQPRFADPLQFQQGISGALELFFWAWLPFQKLVGEVTGSPPPVFQRIDQAGFALPLDERVLDDCDTLFLFGLDHNATGQQPSAAEIEALRDFLKREGTRLVIGPHHDVGNTDDMGQRAVEHAHHGDPLVPRQQRFGRYALSLLQALDVPVVNQWGLRPATLPDGGPSRPVPLEIARDLDTRGWLAGVDSFNFHMHMPHYALIRDDGSAHALARQPIDTSRPHPFLETGATAFNVLVWAPPRGERAGDVLVVDSTVFSSLFGADASLERFWKNIVTAS
jgi:hypothetical protein